MAGEIVKKLELDELKRIYRDHVREDFPRSERHPFSSMKRMTKAGKYACYSYYDNGSLQAYACYIPTENGMYALLDYFAVVPGLRGHGVGSEFLQHLKNVAPVKYGVFVEAIREIDAILKMEGMSLTQADLDMLKEIRSGKLTTDEARQKILSEV